MDVDLDGLAADGQSPFLPSYCICRPGGVSTLVVILSLRSFSFLIVWTTRSTVEREPVSQCGKLLVDAGTMNLSLIILLISSI